MSNGKDEQSRVVAAQGCPTGAPKTIFPQGIRLAQPGDEARLWDFCRDGYLDSAIFPMAEDKVRAVIHRGCNRGTPPCVIAILDGPDRIEASVCLDAAQPWYSNAWVWHDRWIHVHYAHRHSLHFIKLMRFVRWFAETNPECPVFFGVESLVEVERKMRVYGRFGQCVGGAFGLNIQVGVKVTELLD